MIYDYKITTGTGGILNLADYKGICPSVSTSSMTLAPILKA